MKKNLDLARECGATIVPNAYARTTRIGFDASELNEFAERIRAEEQERCALVADKERAHSMNSAQHHRALDNDDMTMRWETRAHSAQWVASEIRMGPQ